MIYFIQNDLVGSVKIGRTNRIRTRLSELKCHVGSPLTILRTIDAPDWVEKWLHIKFIEYRLTGEWFEFNEDMLHVVPPLEKPEDAELKCSVLGSLDNRVPLFVRILPPLKAEIVEAAYEDHISVSRFVEEAIRDRLKLRRGAAVETG